MDINITEYFNDGDHWHNSNSAMHLGDNAGALTWEHSKQESSTYVFVNDETRQPLRDYFLSFGAWEDHEINELDDIELNAFFLQWISGDINESFGYDADLDTLDWSDYEARAEAGEIAGNIFKADDNQIYTHVGN